MSLLWSILVVLAYIVIVTLIGKWLLHYEPECESEKSTVLDYFSYFIVGHLPLAIILVFIASVKFIMSIRG